jgi:PTH1 family peptidyl-tRNA hydrolase
MKIIIGLGNPGKKYKKTRHNAGFMMIDKLKESYGFPDLEFNKKFDAEVSKGNIGDKEVLLVKPQTFMNNSGQSVRSLLDFYKITADDILVVHDDLDIALGKYKVAVDSSSAGHNGVQDIFEKLGTQKIARIRIGIGQEKDGAPVCRIDASDYVLQKFPPQDLEKLEKMTGNILQEMENWIKKTP